MRYRVKLLFHNRQVPVTFFFSLPEPAVGEDFATPTPGEVQAIVEESGCLTTEEGANVSWDPDIVEFSEVIAAPKEHEESLGRCVPPGVRLRHG